MKSNDVMKITSRGLFRGSRKQPNKKKKQKKSPLKALALGT